MYISPYYNQQVNLDRIDSQIKELENMRNQYQRGMAQQPSINQTFQLAPTSQGAIRFANSLDEVNKEVVYVDTPFFTKDFSVMWLKNAKGDIKSYSLTEIVQKDEKDLQIEYLKCEIEKLKKEIIKDEPSYANDVEPVTE